MSGNRAVMFHPELDYARVLSNKVIFRGRGRCHNMMLYILSNVSPGGTATIPGMALIPWPVLEVGRTFSSCRRHTRTDLRRVRHRSSSRAGTSEASRRKYIG